MEATDVVPQPPFPPPEDSDASEDDGGESSNNNPPPRPTGEVEAGNLAKLPPLPSSPETTTTPAAPAEPGMEISLTPPPKEDGPQSKVRESSKLESKAFVYEYAPRPSALDKQDIKHTHAEGSSKLFTHVQGVAKEKGFQILTHQYPLVYQQVKTGLYVLKRMASYIKRQWEKYPTFVEKIHEVVERERNVKYAGMEGDVMEPVLAALKDMHELDQMTAGRLGKLSRDVASLVVLPAMEKSQVLEMKLKDVHEIYSSAHTELTKLNDQFDHDHTACANALAELRGIRSKAVESGINWTSELKRLIVEQDERNQAGADDSQLTGVVKEGWLEKTGQFNTRWKRRYCRLEQTPGGIRLEYFKGKGDKKSQGSVPLDGTRIKASISNTTTFFIHTKGRTYTFKAESEGLCQEWVNSLVEHRKEMDKGLILSLLEAKEKSYKAMVKVEESRDEAIHGLRKYTSMTLPHLLRQLQDIEAERIEIMQVTMKRYHEIKLANFELEMRDSRKWNDSVTASEKLSLETEAVVKWLNERGFPPPVAFNRELPAKSEDFKTDRWFSMIGLGEEDEGRPSCGFRNSAWGSRIHGVTSLLSPTRATIKPGGRRCHFKSGSVVPPLPSKDPEDPDMEEGDKESPMESEMWCRALREHASLESGALSFKYDDVIVVTDTDVLNENMELARAKYTFKGVLEKGELPFEKFDVIQVLGKEEKSGFESWWYGRVPRTGQKGIVPVNYLELYGQNTKTAKMNEDFEPDESAGVRGQIGLRKGTIVTVMKTEGLWSMIKFEHKFGNVLTSRLEILAEGKGNRNHRVKMWAGYLAGHPEKCGNFPAHFVQSVEEMGDDYASDNDQDDEEKQLESHGNLDLPSGSKASTKSRGTLDIIRAKVSKKKRRFLSHDFDLDLTYIEHNIVAMGFPSEGMESNYRNSMRDVQRFFELRHPDTYWIYNLCSERRYDPSKFKKRVSVHAFDDHNPCPFDYIQVLTKEAEAWINEDEKNVCAIHCKAGKGRTGFVVACLLMHINKWFDARRALRLFASKRTKDQQGVTIPSQIRYVHYYERYLDDPHRIPASKPLRLMSIRILGIPKPVKTMVTSSEVAGVDMWFVAKTRFKRPAGLGQLTANEYTSRGRVKCEVRRDLDYILFTSGLGGITTLDDDARIEFFLQPRSGLSKKPSKLFRFWFNTRFIEPEEVDSKGISSESDRHMLMADYCYRLTLEKPVIDEACKDKKHKIFSNGMQVEVVMRSAMVSECSPKEHRNSADIVGLNKTPSKTVI